MKKLYDIAFVVTFEAESYDEALREAAWLAEGVGNQEEISFSAVIHYERDDEGQRVLYLHDEAWQT